jgi:hypothetical protein
LAAFNKLRMQVQVRFDQTQHTRATAVVNQSKPAVLLNQSEPFAPAATAATQQL